MSGFLSMHNFHFFGNTFTSRLLMFRLYVLDCQVAFVEVHQLCPEVFADFVH